MATPAPSQRNEARIAELKAQMAAEERMKSEKQAQAKLTSELASATMSAVSAVEETVDSQLSKLQALENMGEESLEQLRERRLLAMKKQHAKREAWKAQGHGVYTEIKNDKEFFPMLKSSERIVAHFGRSATRRCEVLDGHLEILARTHLETRFVKIDAEKCVYLAEKLKIHTLPSTVLIQNGKTDYTMIGFNDLGGDGFTTEILERVLASRGLVFAAEEAPKRGGGPAKSIRAGNVSMGDWED